VAKIASITKAFVTLILLGITVSSVTTGKISSAHAQTNATPTNETGKAATPSKQASESIKGAITSTGHFLQNATQKIAGSKSVQTIVNESSDVLGNATVAIKKYFSSK
jgi:hypothetical protein